MQKLITVQDAADTLGCTPQRIRQMLDEGKLKGVKAGRAWIINARSLQRQVEQRARRDA